MTETLTIRLELGQRQALRARAATLGKTESEVIRDLIAGQLQREGTLRERAGRHLGALDFNPAAPDCDPWRAHLRRMNTRS